MSNRRATRAVRDAPIPARGVRIHHNMVENIRDALVEADSENAEAYERNAEEYIAELEALDAEIRDMTGGACFAAAWVIRGASRRPTGKG